MNLVDVDVLLLSGSNSPDYLRKNTKESGKFLPNARFVEFQGLDHRFLAFSCD